MVRGVRLSAALLAGALVLACTGDDDVDPGPIGGDEPVEDPADDADDDDGDGDADGADADEGDDEVDEFAAPDDPADIDAAYVDAVLDRMHEGLVPAARDAVAAGEVTDELRDALADVYTGDAIELQYILWEARVTGEHQGTEVRQAVEDLDGRVHRTTPRVVDESCIFVEAEVDDTPVVRDDAHPREYHVALVPAVPVPPVNPTPWRIQREGEGDADPSWCES